MSRPDEGDGSGSDAEAGRPRSGSGQGSDSPSSSWFDRAPSEAGRPVAEPDLGFTAPRKAHPCGIGTVVGLICCVSVVVAVLVGSAVQGTVCSSALNDIRAAGDSATSACFESSLSSMELLALQQMQLTTEAVAGEFNKFLEEPRLQMERLRLIVWRSHREPKTQEWGHRTGGLLWQELEASSMHSASSGSDVATQGLGMYWTSPYVGAPLGMTYFKTPRGMYIFSALNRSAPTDETYIISLATPFTGAPMELPRFRLPVVTTTDYDFFNDAVIAPGPVNGSFAHPDLPRWGAVTSITTYVGIQLSLILRDHYGTHVGLLAYCDLAGISRQLDRVVRNACPADGKCLDVRIYTAVRSSWHPSMEEKQTQGLLTGTSHGNCTKTVVGNPQEGVANSNLGFYKVPLMDRNATDVVIRGIARWVHEQPTGYEGILTRPGGSFVFASPTFEGTEAVEEEYMVGVTNITEPQGLDWYMVFCVPTASILGAARDQQAQLTAQTDAKVASVERDTKQQRDISSVVVLLLAIVFAMISTVLVQTLCVQPIIRVQLAMRNVASMDLESADVGKASFMHDVRQMQEDFQIMVSSLLEFRAYVPASLLGLQDTPMGNPPDGDVAVLFTDIKNSTALWTESPVGMDAAMELHNSTIRRLCCEYNGYEVKTIGDSFMIALQEPMQAMHMATSLQEELAKIDWPDSLSLPPGGMGVRIGANYGPVVLESNPITGRTDYRGETVIFASRCEHRALVGTTCITSALVSKLGGVAALERHMIHAQPMGSHELKGLGHHQLHVVVCPAHVHRCAESTSDCYVPAPLSKSTRAETKLRLNANELRGGSDNIGPGDDMGSMKSSSVLSAGSYVAARRTGLQLARGNATIVVCRLTHDVPDSSMLDYCNLMIRSANDAANMLGGSIGLVSGSSVTVMFNVSKRCHTHSECAMRYAQRIDARSGGHFRVGSATGHVLHGNVGTQNLRFATAIGHPFDLAHAMADYAESLDTFCLHCICGQEPRALGDPTIGPCLRLIDVWEDADSLRRVYVLQVDIDTARACERLYHAASDTVAFVENKANVLHTQLLRRALNDPSSADAAAAVEQLREQTVLYPEDHVLQTVLRQLTSSEPRCGCRAQVTLRWTPTFRAWLDRDKAEVNSSVGIGSAGSMRSLRSFASRPVRGPPPSTNPLSPEARASADPVVSDVEL